jgi:hypothetical protein
VRLEEEALPGVKFATFRYRDDLTRKYKGVIAQDLEAAGNGYLVTEIDGVKHVPHFLAPELIDV